MGEYVLVVSFVDYGTFQQEILIGELNLSLTDYYYCSNRRLMPIVEKRPVIFNPLLIS